MSLQLRRAAENGDVDKIRLRLDAGDDIESRDKGTGRTALLYAAIEGQAEAVRILLDYGADLHASCTAVGYDGLLWAVEQGHLELVKLFLSQGADPNHVPDNSFLGRTPLMVAAQRGFLEIAKALVEAGADPGVFDRQGTTALRLAIEQSRGSMEEFLRSLPNPDPEPPKEPEPIPWPNKLWDESAPIPESATPAQITHRYIMAMYRWETDAYLDSEAARKTGRDFDLDASLATAHSIRDRYCTDRKRVWVGQGVGYPPTFDESLSMLSEEYPKPNRCEILARNQKDSSNGRMYIEMLFVLLRKQGQWRIDNVKDRPVGTLSWNPVIL